MKKHKWWKVALICVVVLVAVGVFLTSWATHNDDFMNGFEQGIRDAQRENNNR